MLVGIVGRPSSGKSTFFKAATLADVLIADYPFATIKPNHGMGYVKIEDLAPEFGKKSDPREGFVKSGLGEGGKKVDGKWRFVPFELLDVAGLVEGASEGKGLGNEFLNDLSAADAFIHVVDMSGESNGEGKPAENYYPGEDIKMVEKELDLWYLGILKKVWKTFSRQVEMEKSGFAEAVAKQFSGLKVSEDDVKSVVLQLKLDGDGASKWSPEEISEFARALRRETKPMIIAANKMDRPGAQENIEKINKEFDYEIVPCFSEGELALREADKGNLIEYVPGEVDFEIIGKLSDKQRKGLEEIKKVMEGESSTGVDGEGENSTGVDGEGENSTGVDGEGESSTGVDANSPVGDSIGTGVQEVLNKTVFELLGMVAIFPAGDKLADSKGNVLPDCYLMPAGSTALDFAFRLHSDIGEGFIKAIDIRTKKAVGKEYKLKNRDGLEILTK